MDALMPSIEGEDFDLSAFPYDEFFSDDDNLTYDSVVDGEVTPKPNSGVLGSQPLDGYPRAPPTPVSNCPVDESTSFNLEQPSLEHAWPSGDLHAEQRKSKRPRDESPGSSRSDASLSEHNRLRNCTSLIERRLETLPKHTLLAVGMSRRQRRALHAQAHMKDLNHLSFGPADQRCLAISRHPIAPAAEREETANCFWDEQCSSQTVDLTCIHAVIIEEAVPQTKSGTSKRAFRRLSMVEIGQLLQQRSLPMPTIRDSMPICFSTVDVVAQVCTALHGFEMSCGKLSIQFQTRPSQTLPICRPSPSVEDVWSVEVNMNGQSPPNSALKLPQGNPSSSKASILSRRSRQRTIEGGYECDECHRIFSRACDLGQHSKFHLPDDQRPHRCESCRKGFVYPKDLRKHVPICPGVRQETGATLASSSQDGQNMTTHYQADHSMAEAGPNQGQGSHAYQPDFTQPTWSFGMRFEERPLPDISKSPPAYCYKATLPTRTISHLGVETSLSDEKDELRLSPSTLPDFVTNSSTDIEGIKRLLRPLSEDPFSDVCTRYSPRAIVSAPSAPERADSLKPTPIRRRRKSTMQTSSCSACGKFLKNPSDAHKHKLQHTRPYHCIEFGCTRKNGFATPNDLARHGKSVHNVVPSVGKATGYICIACSNAGHPEKWWPRLDNFRAHIKRKHWDWNATDLVQRSECARPDEHAEQPESLTISGQLKPAPTPGPKDLDMFMQGYDTVKHVLTPEDARLEAQQRPFGPHVPSRYTNLDVDTTVNVSGLTPDEIESFCPRVIPVSEEHVHRQEDIERQDEARAFAPAAEERPGAWANFFNPDQGEKRSK